VLVGCLALEGLWDAECPVGSALKRLQL